MINHISIIAHLSPSPAEPSTAPDQFQPRPSPIPAVGRDGTNFRSCLFVFLFGWLLTFLENSSAALFDPKIDQTRPY